MSVGLLSTGATPTAFVFAMGGGEGSRAVVIESTGPGIVAELTQWDDDLDSVDDIEQGWHVGSCLRYEDSVGPRVALAERWTSHWREVGTWPRS